MLHETVAWAPGNAVSEKIARRGRGALEAIHQEAEVIVAAKGYRKTFQGEMRQAKTPKTNSRLVPRGTLAPEDSRLAGTENEDGNQRVSGTIDSRSPICLWQLSKAPTRGWAGACPETRWWPQAAKSTGTPRGDWGERVSERALGTREAHQRLQFQVQGWRRAEW